ncbi:unnamed protein product [Triticum turgidum subsp. durum]|uniref:F-box domain-containing protein n=1 Tax=Triticum turgidum subsp. durum TaxID=4567 RepID=A0A9R0XT81_TRITD|nr:unnamed protein product [Triticum turgidum subsp. durum]
MSCEEMSRRRRRLPPSPAAAPPLEDENLLSEILLRLPPDPSSLPRASVVSKRWRRLISDPGFSRRFRLHHRRNPPLLGSFSHLYFVPTMEAPNRVPDGHFCLQVDEDEVTDHFICLGCRHGLVLIFHVRRLQVLVWDPVTGELHRVAAPPGFDAKERPISGAVLRAAGDIQHFQVVLVTTQTDDQQHTRAMAKVYSSGSGNWGDIFSTLLPSQASRHEIPTMIGIEFPAVLVGHSLYWLLTDSRDGILKFDLDRQSLSVIHVPVNIYAHGNWQFTVMRAEGGGLGGLFLSKFTAQLWKWKTGSDGVASWVLGKTIELDKLLSISSKKREPPMILGFAEDNNVVFLWTDLDVFMIKLQSLQFKNLGETNILSRYHPLESVYAAGMGIGGGRGGAELLPNT